MSDVSFGITASKVELTDRQRERAERKFMHAMSVTSMGPKSCAVRVSPEGDPDHPKWYSCDADVSLPDKSVHATEHARDVDGAINEAADSVERQLRRFKTQKYGTKRRESMDIRDIPYVFDEPAV